ncbi:MAG TPA: lipopolysaccharide biosynthesis protein [Anaerolineales bacterium]|nr:lipopolysaccharide biosynthesis protein [Anaerolineales bacterium]
MRFAGTLLKDELLARVLRTSMHLFSSNAAGLALSVFQGILAARMLGPAGYGLIGIVMSYASTINGLLSFRMGEVVVRYGGEYLENGEHRKAAALIKASALAEAVVSLLAFLVVAASAGLATRFAAKATGIEWMFVVYGIGLLCNFNAETATGVLQITNRIKARGTLNFIQAICSASIILAAFIWNERSGLASATALAAVLLAFLAGKAILGVGIFTVAWKEASLALGEQWPSAEFSALPSLRELAGFAVSSNFSATAILVFRESEVLWVGLLLNSEAAGLYKVAYTIVGLLSVPADPLILSAYPEVNRLVVQKAWMSLKRFLRRVTGIALLYNVFLGLVYVVLGRWILSVFGHQYVVAYPAVVALLVGMIYNYSLFWNRPLLLSFGLQTFALRAIVVAGVLKVALAMMLVPRYGYVMEAWLLSGYYALSVSLIALRGTSQLKRRAVQSEVVLS